MQYHAIHAVCSFIVCQTTGIEYTDIVWEVFYPLPVDLYNKVLYIHVAYPNIFDVFVGKERILTKSRLELLLDKDLITDQRSREGLVSAGLARAFKSAPWTELNSHILKEILSLL